MPHGYGTPIGVCLVLGKLDARKMLEERKRARGVNRGKGSKGACNVGNGLIKSRSRALFQKPKQGLFAFVQPSSAVRDEVFQSLKVAVDNVPALKAVNHGWADV